jgi:hypothetical protein
MDFNHIGSSISQYSTLLLASGVLTGGTLALCRYDQMADNIPLDEEALPRGTMNLVDIFHSSCSLAQNLNVF